MEELLKMKRGLEQSLAILNAMIEAGGGAPSRSPPAASPGVTIAQNSYGKTTVAFDNPNWFFETCHLLKAHPKAEPRDVEAFESLPSGLNKYGSLTEGQWKLFKALHNKLLGTWPDPSAAAPAPATVGAMTADDLSEVPF